MDPGSALAGSLGRDDGAGSDVILPQAAHEKIIFASGSPLRAGQSHMEFSPISTVQHPHPCPLPTRGRETPTSTFRKVASVGALWRFRKVPLPRVGRG
jgi:hypothetical protein